jgi:hypothetical protein
MKTPRTTVEWQEAVDAAEACLALESARMYGLVTGGPEVNVERAQALLINGGKRGIYPRPDAIERFIAESMKGVET